MRSSDARRNSSGFAASGDGSSPSFSSRARMKRSRGCFGQSARFTEGIACGLGAAKDQ